VKRTCSQRKKQNREKPSDRQVAYILRAANDAEAQAAAKSVRVEITNASEFADKRDTFLRVE
jgi:hypothetical protein